MLTGIIIIAQATSTENNLELSLIIRDHSAISIFEAFNQWERSNVGAEPIRVWLYLRQDGLEKKMMERFSPHCAASWNLIKLRLTGNW